MLIWKSVNSLEIPVKKQKLDQPQNRLKIISSGLFNFLKKFPHGHSNCHKVSLNMLFVLHERTYKRMEAETWK